MLVGCPHVLQWNKLAQTTACLRHPEITCKVTRCDLLGPALTPTR